MNKKNLNLITVISLVLLCMAALSAGCTTPAQPAAQAPTTTHTITDMTGRSLEVPQSISRVLSTAPPTTIAVYVLAPDKLIGVNFDPNPVNGNVYMPEKYHALPNVGG